MIRKLILVGLLLLPVFYLFSQDVFGMSQTQQAIQADARLMANSPACDPDQDFKQWDGKMILEERVVEEFNIKPVNDLSPYVNEALFDSVINYYNTSDFEKMFPVTPYDLFSISSIKNTYAHVLRKAYGEIVKYKPAEKEIYINYENKNHKWAFIIYNCNFENGSGQLKLWLSIDSNVAVLKDIVFYQNDYLQIPLLISISQNDLLNITLKNWNQLQLNTTTDFKEKIENGKLQHRLGALNLVDATIRKGEIYYNSNGVYVSMVYNLPNAKSNIFILYKYDSGAFKISNLEFRSKNNADTAFN